MRIIALSDTHGSHLGIKIPDGDALVHCGDFCSHGGLADAMHFLNWFNMHPHRHKIFCAGNHDWIFEKEPGMIEALVKREFPELVYLNDSNIVVDGIKFHASPVSPRFFNWAFNRDRGEDIKRHWDMIPPDIDVLITHGPPYGYCDEAYRVGYNITEKVGCRDLLDATLRVAPKLHLFGHIHYSGGRSHVAPKTTYANVSVLNEQYLVEYKPMIFDIDFEKTVSIMPN